MSLHPSCEALANRPWRENRQGDTDYSIADLADDLEVVRAHLAADEKIALGGLSMGGYVAFEYWNRHAEHLSHLILANTKPNADDVSGQAARLAMAEKALKEGTWPAVSGMLEKLLPTGARENQPEVYALVEIMMRSVQPHAVAAAQRAMARRQDFLTKLACVQVPTLVLTGELDGIAPPEQTFHWASQIPGSQTIVFPKVGHLSPLEAADVFNRSVESFLSSPHAEAL